MLPVIAAELLDGVARLNGRAVPTVDLPWWCDYPGEATRSLCLVLPAENGAVLDLVVDVAGDDAGRARLQIFLPDPDPGHEALEATVREVDGARSIVPVQAWAARTADERVLLAVFGQYGQSFDDLDALLEEVAYLGGLPIRWDRPVQSIEVGS